MGNYQSAAAQKKPEAFTNPRLGTAPDYFPIPPKVLPRPHYGASTNDPHNTPLGGERFVGISPEHY